MTVIDASAVLALLQDEPGAEAVEDAIDGGAIISAVNLSEVLAKMVDAGAELDRATDLVVGLFVEIAPFELTGAREAAAIRAAAPASGLSLGDRACLALAASLGRPAITTDRRWLDSAEAIGVEVQLIR